MESRASITEKNCRKEDICLYLDGELLPNEEIIIEKHLAECENCFEEFNLQKQMLSSLDFAFEKRSEIELPKDFTKVVVVKAECSVRGLRSKEERSIALFFVLALFLLFAVGFVAESKSFISTFSILGNQILVLAEFFIHLAYNISIGIAVILRSLSQQVVFSTGFLIFLTIIIMLISVLTVPRLVLKLNRAKTS